LQDGREGAPQIMLLLGGKNAKQLSFHSANVAARGLEDLQALWGEPNDVTTAVRRVDFAHDQGAITKRVEVANQARWVALAPARNLLLGQPLLTEQYIEDHVLPHRQPVRLEDWRLTLGNDTEQPGEHGAKIVVQVIISCVH
jgi:hypothetical protein